ncbi:hypothetical protein H0H93_007121, partial [Arthromyces matolae]
MSTRSATTAKTRAASNQKVAKKPDKKKGENVSPPTQPDECIDKTQPIAQKNVKRTDKKKVPAEPNPSGEVATLAIFLFANLPPEVNVDNQLEIQPSRARACPLPRKKVGPVVNPQPENDHPFLSPRRWGQPPAMQGTTVENDREDFPDQEDTLNDSPLGMTNRTNKPGPISDAGKEQAYAAQEQYHQEIRQIAINEKKPAQVIFSLLEGSGTMRKTSTWNAFQAWWGLEGPGANQKQTADTSSPDAPLPDAPFPDNAKVELFKPIIEWYNQKYVEAIEEKKMKGNFPLIVRKVVDAFEKMCLKFYKLYGLHCGGAVLNVDPDVTGRTDSALWGSTPELDKIKKGEVVFIDRQLKQLESLVMVKIANAEGRKVDAMLIVGPDIKRISGEPERDYARALNHHGRSITQVQDVKIPWTTWPDYAYSKKICFGGWPLTARAPGPGF